jgi:ketosteroid isomerase-like protein
MLTENTTSKTEALIRTQIDSWAKAFHAQDIDTIMSHYAPDILAFDAIGQLQFKGIDAYRAHWTACMSMCAGPFVFEIHELGITAGDNLAFAHYVCRCGGTNERGEQQTGWMRVTLCFTLQNDQWLIAHEHFSSPFDPATGKVLSDLSL